MSRLQATSCDPSAAAPTTLHRERTQATRDQSAGHSGHRPAPPATWKHVEEGPGTDITILKTQNIGSWPLLFWQETSQSLAAGQHGDHVLSEKTDFRPTVVAAVVSGM